MMQMTSLFNPAQVALSIHRPEDADFAVNTIWAERVRDIYKGGIEIDNNSETDIKLMESVFSGVDYRPTVIQTNPADIENFYIRDTNVTSYTDEEIDALINSMNDITNRNINRLVVTTDQRDIGRATTQVYDRGMVISTTNTTQSSDEEDPVDNG
jgi:hypothetical protein